MIADFGGTRGGTGAKQHIIRRSILTVYIDNLLFLRLRQLLGEMGIPFGHMPGSFWSTLKSIHPGPRLPQISGTLNIPDQFDNGGGFVAQSSGLGAEIHQVSTGIEDGFVGTMISCQPMHAREGDWPRGFWDDRLAGRQAKAATEGEGSGRRHARQSGMTGRRVANVQKCRTSQ